MPELNTVIVPVHDLAAGKAVYQALLGTAPSMDEPYYVGFDVPGAHLGLDPHGHAKGMTAGVAYWDVPDLRGVAEQLVAAGGAVVEEPHDVGGGKLVALCHDADGNAIGLIQPA